MGKTSIEWVRNPDGSPGHTINPIRAESDEGRVGHYCEKVSAGCKNCYSSRMQRRFGMPEFPEARSGGVRPFFDLGKLDEVRLRKIPTRYFWCDMTDLFGAWVPDEWIGQCFVTMATTPHHTHLVLTKRPERMRKLLSDPPLSFPLEMLGGKPLSNVHLGVSCEDQATADARIPILLDTPAAVRFVSAEPLLDPIDFTRLPIQHEDGDYHCDQDALRGVNRWNGRPMPKLDWVIVGGESGPKARPMDLHWARSIVAQCRAAGVPVFVKQLGANPTTDHRTRPAGDTPWVLLKDRKGGDMAEWPEDLRMREFPHGAETQALHLAKAREQLAFLESQGWLK